MKKKKILYLMVVDWAWIKQRPQFIAEELAKKFNLFVVYPLNNNRRKMQKRNKKNGFKYLPLFRFPKEHSFKLIKNINLVIKRIIFKLIFLFFKPDIIWISHPENLNYLPSNFKGKVVYDCMDDYVAMSITKEKNLVKSNEEQLISISDLILISSNKLKEKIIINYNPEINKLHIVRNGYNGNEVLQQDLIKESKVYKIGYIGTISDWFDFKLLLKSLDDFPNIEYHLIGPIGIDTKEISHERIKFYSTIEHDLLYKYVQNFDCMIMPFLLNDITTAVDPVKLYEYISYNKNIISVYYPEINRFNEFVYFYSNYDDFRKIISDLLKNNSLKYSESERKNFLNDNTWENRGKNIIDLLNSL